MSGSRFVTNTVLPLFGFELPENPFGAQEQNAAIDALIQSFPSAMWKNSANYAFLLIFEQKQGSAGFVAAAAASIYAFTLPLAQRHPIHFLFTVLSAVMTIANANHAGLSFLGEHPFVSPAGRNVGLLFVPFWLVSAFCNYMAFTLSKDALAKAD